MRKILIYTFVVLFTLVVGAATLVWTSIVRIQLPHGAVLHVLPAMKTGQSPGAVILCPGGGFSYLETWKEGYMWFPFFYTRGYAVALLEYRLPDGDSRAPLTDGSEAVAVMRKRAAEWGFDDRPVGIVGFSAGGYLASALMVSDSDAVRPDFGVLFYPVVSMKKELTHPGTHDRLLGKDAPDSLEAAYSSELHVSPKTPPAYIAVSSDDVKVNPRNALLFRDAMLAEKRPVRLRVYPSGGHGWGLRILFGYRGEVGDDLAAWLADGPDTDKTYNR